MDFLRGATRGRIVSTVTASMLVLSACGPAGQATPTSAPAANAPAATSAPAAQPAPATQATAAPKPTVAPAAGQAKPGGRVILGEFADAKTLNPVTVTDVPSDVVTTRIYSALLSVDAKTGDVGPNLAEKWDFSADGKTLSFQLRDGLKFSDGSPLTGDDFKFTVMATLRSKKTNHKNNVDQIVGAKEYIDGTADDVSGIKIDGKNITVTLTNSFCPALNQIGGLNIIPKSV